ncbi:MAG: hypothetical protein KIT35_20585 [Piscinibacter sp.]|uniref:hypothetical protein n=1 Tax=Piscinibacter sp. TaxID=1903157 RepID=UPI0025889CC4|nr:hypothetical protein [Piscinibacter sp.]MCW5666234.1 hypothetical protein [Piscinibacter sp.]
MIRYGNRLTLSEVDIRRWTRITGFEPTAIATMDDLEDYVRDCKRYYAEPSDDSAFLNWLMDVELERYGGRPAGSRPVQLAVVDPDQDRVRAERELLWSIALDGDLARRSELTQALDGQSGGLRLPNTGADLDGPQ